jgi:hypothetical protein
MSLRRFARIATAVALVVASSSAAAQLLLADFSGGWNVLVEGPQGPMSSTLTLAQTGDSVSGKFESEVGSATVRGSVTGDSLHIVFALDVGGQALDLEGKGALKDTERMDGKIIAAGMGEFPFSATRQPK